MEMPGVGSANMEYKHNASIPLPELDGEWSTNIWSFLPLTQLERWPFGYEAEYKQSHIVSTLKL